MDSQITYRHELKYQIRAADYYAIRARISAIMKHDCNATESGTYIIRSIYFDNYRDKALREKIDGLPIREKFRIRFYNNDFSYITLEKKIKHNSLCVKEDADISQDEFKKIICDPGVWMANHNKNLVRELWTKMQTQQLRPRVIVSYKREPFVYNAGNVRVTFDSNIRTSLFQSDFATGILPDIPADNSDDTIILEVKYDNVLPDVIACLLQTGNLHQQAFSKYGACRRFG